MLCRSSMNLSLIVQKIIDEQAEGVILQRVGSLYVNGRSPLLVKLKVLLLPLLSLKSSSPLSSPLFAFCKISINYFFSRAQTWIKRRSWWMWSKKRMENLSSLNCMSTHHSSVVRHSSLITHHSSLITHDPSLMSSFTYLLFFHLPQTKRKDFLGPASRHADHHSPNRRYRFLHVWEQREGRHPGTPSGLQEERGCRLGRGRAEFAGREEVSQWYSLLLLPPFFFLTLSIFYFLFIFISWILLEYSQVGKFTIQPVNHWNIKNIRIFLESFAKNRHLDPLQATTWYNIKSDEIRKAKVSLSLFHPPSLFLSSDSFLVFIFFERIKNGRAVLDKFKGGYFHMLRHIFKEIQFDERVFRRSMFFTLYSPFYYF